MSQVWVFFCVCFLTAGLAWRNPTNSPAFNLATVAWSSSTQFCPTHSSDSRGHGQRPAAHRLEASALCSCEGDLFVRMLNDLGEVGRIIKGRNLSLKSY